MIDGGWDLLSAAHRRMWRASAALTLAGIRHAVIGSHALDHWICWYSGTRGEFSTNCDVLLDRRDRERCRTVLVASDCAAVRLYFTGTRPEGWGAALPTLDDVASDGDRRVIGLDSFIQMKVASERLRDRGHLRDLIDAGVLRTDSLARFPPKVAAVLRELIEDPNG